MREKYGIVLVGPSPEKAAKSCTCLILVNGLALNYDKLLRKRARREVVAFTN